MIKTVYLDMDGVLVDFHKGVHIVFDQPYNYQHKSLYDYDFWSDWDGISREQINEKCTTSFWQNLNWMHDGHDILRLITTVVKPEQIYLLTTPMPNPESATGKTLWVEKHMPEYKKRLIITQAPKHMFAKSDTLLIDDKTENVDDFIEAGGYGLLVPRPWNIDYGMADYTTQIVEERLEEYPICQE